MPGYAGHRPQARDIVAQPGCGSVPFKMEPRTLPGQGQFLNNRPTTAWASYRTDGMGEKVVLDKPSVTDQFKQSMGGVKLGYTGHVPQARSHFGTPHYGGCDGQSGGRHVLTRSTSWGVRTLDRADTMGVLEIPSMLGPGNAGDPPGYTRPPQRQLRYDLSDLHSDYGGHRPRRFDRSIDGKVGTPTAAAPAAASKSAQAAWRNATVTGHNDWPVHQAQPPPRLPSSANAYREEVGGITAHCERDTHMDPRPARTVNATMLTTSCSNTRTSCGPNACRCRVRPA